MSNKVAASPLYSILKQLKEETFSDLRVCLPGSIAGIDAETNTASVDIGVLQNVLKLGMPGGIDFPYPQLVGCPLFVVQGGGVGAVMPAKAGDECVVLFSDRALTDWLETGEANPLPSFRMHNIADGIVLVGLNSLQNKLVTSLLADGSEGGLCETKASRPGVGAAVTINPTTHKVAIRNATQSLLTILNLLTTTLTALNTGIAAESGTIPTAAAAANAANLQLVTIVADLAALLTI